MKQLLTDVTPLFLKPETLTENVNGGKLLISGVLQTANKRNQNDRVYPKEILERECEKYLAEFVKPRRGMGELDHPACLRPSAQILTNTGWKYIKDVSIGEYAMTLNLENDEIEYNPIDEVINESYKGKMISIKGKNIDTICTPNHRFILKDRYGKFLEKTAQEIYELSKVTKNPHLSIPLTSTTWNGKEYSTFSINGLSTSQIAFNATDQFIQKQSQPLVLDANSWFAFIGFYLAEGWCADRSMSHNNGYAVHVCQNEGSIANEFRDVLSKLSPELEWIETINNNNNINFRCNDARLWNYLHIIGNKYTKYIPSEIKQASTSLLNTLYEWYLKGDGTCVGQYNRKSLFSVSKTLIEDLNEILLKIGITGVIKEQITTDDYMFADHLIEAKNKSVLYRLWIKESKHIHLDFRFLTVSEIDYNDTVHCVSIKNKNFYCRDERKPFWTGNSEIVNLKNVSHTVIDMKWDGEDLVGTIEILPTPSGEILKKLIESNILLGISSRGVGSVKQDIREGSNIVQDDFNLICFDIVSNPSTYGAFMTPKSLNESVNPKLQKQFVKHQAIERVLRNIISEI
jgi:hypothetical protein